MTKLKKVPGPSLFYALQQKNMHSASLRFLELHEDYGDIVKTAFFPRTYLIRDPNYIHYILQSNPNNYLKKDLAYRIVKKALGESLLTTDQQQWEPRRKITQPFFQNKNLAQYTHGIIECTQQRMATWQSFCATQTPFDIAEEMMILVLKCASKILFSFSLDDDLAKQLVYAGRAENRFATSFLSIFPWLPTLNNFRYRTSHKILDDFIYARLKEHRDSPEKYHDLLSIILEADPSKPLEHFYGEAKTFLMTGHETTGSALSWCWYLLTQNEQAYQKLFSEINDKLGNRPLQFDALSQLEYTQCVFDETLRLYPPLWILGRKTIKDDVIDGYAIPAGTHILLNLHGLHHHSAYWQDPEFFIPERFLKENFQQHRYTFLPFGHGKRVCIAANMAQLMAKTIIATICQNYKFTLAPHQRIEVEHLISFRPLRGIKVIAHKR